MSKSSGRKSKEKGEKNKADAFVWTDDEVELLLDVTNEYKVSKAAENVDWESCQTKYSDILDLYLEQYPSSPEDATILGKEYPHKKDEITKNIVTTKLKNIRLKFRQAIDSGKRSGHGRVVLLYFEQCENIWGGSPATNSISSGIETGDLEGSSDSSSVENTDSTGSLERQDLDLTDLSEVAPDEPSMSTSERRSLLDAKLKGHKSEKLKRKLPAETQFLNLAQEELQIKKQIIEKMDALDNVYSQNMSKLTSNMEKLTSSIASIADGFAIISQQFMIQPHGMQLPPHTPQYQSYPMYPRHSSPTGRHTVPTNRTESNSGHFSYTQSLFSDDRDNIL